MPARKITRPSLLDAVESRTALRARIARRVRGISPNRRSGLARTYSPIYAARNTHGAYSRKRYGGRVSGAWSNYAVPAAKKVGRGVSRVGGAVKTAGVWTAKKGYRGIAYASPKIYHGGKNVYEYISPKIARTFRAASPYITGAARATGSAAHQYIVSPTYEWLAGHARRARTGVANRARRFHEYMMSP